MFRIKPPRNQTTAKHTNLSPYPLNGFGKQLKQTKIIQTKIENKIIKNVQVIPNLKQQLIKPQNKKVESNSNFQVRIVKNPQKVTKPNNFIAHKKNIVNEITKPHERMILKRNDNQNKDHKLNLIKKYAQLNLPKQNEPLKSGKVFEQLKQVGNLKHQEIKQKLIQNKQIKFEQKGQKIVQKDTNFDIISIKQQDKNINISQSSSKITHQNINQKKPIIILENQHQSEKVRLKDQSKEFIEQHQNIHSVQQIKRQNGKKQQICPINNHHLSNTERLKQQQNQLEAKQKQTEELVLKIQKRRQARQKQKRRIKELQQKNRQNQERALQFLASKNQNGNVEEGNRSIEGVAGMLKINDQLMHFSLAENIIDLQLKKLLKTNFDGFPNASQIKYQIQQLQRINLSYEIIKFDQNNAIKNGLTNYRIQIFNRIGDLIMKAQQGGHSNPNFHILETDGRVRNDLFPEAVRGLPQQSHHDFIKFSMLQQDQQCAICLAIIQKGQIGAQLECGHKFHSRCIKQWILSSANCPNCRFNIKFSRKH